MELRNEIKNILGGSIVRVTKYTMEEEEKFKDSPLNNILSVTFKDFKRVKCNFCNNICNNYCWNCEKPHCKKHAHAIFTFPIVNTLCIECFNDLQKEQRENEFNNQ